MSKTVCPRHEVAHEMGSGCPYCESARPADGVVLITDGVSATYLREASEASASHIANVCLGYAVDADAEHVAVGSKAYVVADGARFQYGDPVYIGSDGKAHVGANPVMQDCSCGHRFEHDGLCQCYACPSCDKTLKRQAGGGWA